MTGWHSEQLFLLTRIKGTYATAQYLAEHQSTRANPLKAWGGEEETNVQE